MNDQPESRVSDIVMAAGGRLVSRIRLQKITYLLDKLGADSGFSFSYYHYGPYSRDLDSAILDAEAFDCVVEEFERRKSDGARYSVFKTKGDAEAYEFSYLSDLRLRETANKLSEVNVTVLELAATAHWLLKEEVIGEWKSEIVRRKGSKTADGRLEQATELLASLGLEPGFVPA
jgi:uncharacterized protein